MNWRVSKKGMKRIDLEGTVEMLREQNVVFMKI